MSLNMMRVAVFIAVVGLALPGSALGRSASAMHLSSNRWVLRDSRIAAGLEAHGVRAATSWLRRRPEVMGVSVGRDHRTLLVRFRNRAPIVILPRGSVPIHFPSLHLPLHFAASGTHAAVVLEPFTTDTSGQSVVDALTAAGATVDRYQDAAVTVPLMERLAGYPVVYLIDHAGVLSNGDAVIATGDTATSPYGPFFQDGSLVQVFVAGDRTQRLYDGVTSKFFELHAGPLPSGSLWILNGCNVLAAPGFWTHMHALGLDTLVSWTGEVSIGEAEQAGSALVSALSSGATVSSAIDTLSAQGLATSQYQTKFDFDGDGGQTLAGAFSGAAPTPTPGPSPTTTPSGSSVHLLGVAVLTRVHGHFVAAHAARLGEGLIFELRFRATGGAARPAGRVEIVKRGGVLARYALHQTGPGMMRARATLRSRGDVGHLTVRFHLHAGTATVTRTYGLRISGI